MKLYRNVMVAFGLTALAASGLNAQNVVSAKAGLVHLVEGDVFLDDQQLQPKVTEFPGIKDNQVLRTEVGRVEVLLAPGTFLRMGENASFKMLSNQLADTRIQVLSGEVMLEVAEFAKENALTVSLAGGIDVTPKKAGIYRFDGDPAQVRVYEGEATATSDGQTWALKSGKLLASSEGALKIDRFDSEIGDALYRWSKRRSGYTAMANVSAASNSGRFGYSGLGYGGYGGYGSYGAYGYTGMGGCGSWAFNPYFGMMTLIPCRGMISSPFGWRYYTPGSVYQAFWQGGGGGGRYGGGGGAAMNPRTPVFDSNLGYGVFSGRSYGGGYSGGGSMGGGGGSVSAGPAPSAAPVGGGSMRGGAEAAGRGSSGGGGRGR